MDPVQLSCEVGAVDGVPLVHVDGDLNAWAVEAFEAAISEACGCGSQMVILDLTRVKTLDVGALKVLQKAAQALGPDRKICAIACGRARAVLEMTRFDEILNVYPRLKDALDTAGDIAARSV